MVLFFCLHSLYTALRLVSFKNCPSKWSYNGVAGWSQAMFELGFSDQFLLSFAGLDRAAAMESTSRFLPTPSCSALALLALLVRWAYNLPTRGGMRDEQGRSQAKLLVAALFSCCAAPGGTWHLSVVITQVWSCRWPRPPVGGHTDLLPVDADGFVDISLWRDRIESAVLPRGDPLRQWWKSMENATTTDGRAKLLDFVVAASRSASCKSLFAQLIWGVANQVQEVLLNTDSPSELVGRLVLHGASDFRPNAKAGDFHLARYIEAGAAQIGQPMQLSLVTDKAQVKGLSLSNCIAVTSDNYGVIFPPQAAQGTFSLFRLVLGGCASRCAQPPPPPPRPPPPKSSP